MKDGDEGRGEYRGDTVFCVCEGDCVRGGVCGFEGGGECGNEGSDEVMKVH